MLDRVTWWALGAALVLFLALILIPGCALPPPAQVTVTVSNCAGWRHSPRLSDAEIDALSRTLLEWLVAHDEQGRQSGCW